MKNMDIKDLYRKSEEFYDKKITISGWIRTLRDQKNFAFIEINDGSFFSGLQVIAEREKLENLDEIAKLGISSAIEVEGVLVHTPDAKQEFELKAETITILSKSDLDYPLQKKRHTLEYLRTISHLRPRTNTFMATFRLRSVLAEAVHKFFTERNFVYVHTPILTASDAEGAGDLFQVTTLDLENLPMNEEKEVDYTQDFFGSKVGLTVSGQLEAEIMAMALKKVYTFGPTFRAENSHTARHASEFWMVEPEIAFADLKENMDLAEEMIKFLIKYCMEKLPEEMNFFASFVDKDLKGRLENVVNSDFERITYTEAINLLLESKEEFDYEVEWGVDLQTEHERYITEKIFKKPVFVTDYPKEIKAFYMRENEDKKTVAAMDLLVPGVGEIIGGSQREERYDILKGKIEALGMKVEDYDWYLELRKYGGVKHSGYGMGFERMLMYLSGMQNIRDVLPFPRTPGSIEI